MSTQNAQTRITSPYRIPATGQYVTTNGTYGNAATTDIIRTPANIQSR